MRRVKGEERGQALVEYALIIALVSLAAIVALGFLSGKINDLFSKSGNTLAGVQVASGGGGTTTPPPPSPPANATAITSGNSNPFSNASGNFYAAGSVQVCDPGIANQIACGLGGGNWTTVGQPGIYATGRTGSCSFTYTATGYSFSGSWSSAGQYRVGTSGGTDFLQACL